MLKVLDFYATWCKPCKLIDSYLDEALKEVEFTVEKINVDKEEDLVQQYKIKAVPTLIVFKDDVQVDRITGTITPRQLLTKLKSYELNI
jgi:thioredoxin 1